MNSTATELIEHFLFDLISTGPVQLMKTWSCNRKCEESIFGSSLIWISH